MFGFTNSGSTCWFNASMQLLVHIPQIANLFRHEMFDQMLYTKRKNASELANEISNLVKMYWNATEPEKVYDISGILEIFAKINRNFAGKKQYDSVESFLALVSTLESAMVQKKTEDEHPIPFGDTNMEQWNEYSKKNWKTFLSDLFLGQSEQTYKDSVTYEHFTGLVIQPRKTLEQGIKDYLSDGDITRKFTRLPLILPIILQKNSDKEFVFYDFELDVCGVEYSLFGMLLHEGVDNDGHWVACCSNNDTWYKFDDQKVDRVYDMNSLIQKNAMLLLYKRRV